MWNERNGHVGQRLVAFALSVGAAGVWASGCAEPETSYGGDRGSVREIGGNGGAMATGGVDSGTGGQIPSTGGSATGGAPGSGGGSGRGGASTGGLSATGGRASTGGAPATGGMAPSTGGRSATGGAPATGGALATGGTISTGGVVGTGGVPATGGSKATGGSGSVPDNVLMSYSFEESTTDGWRGRGAASVAVSDEEHHTGSFALKVTGRTAAWHGTEYDVMSLVTPGDAYDVTAWARLTEGSASATLILTREVQGCDIDQFLRLDTAENATDAAWVELSGTLTLPASCDPTRLLLFVESDDATASYYVDDTSMTPQ
jgi:hypothetical protein